MLLCKELGEMSIEDLNQRYQETVMRYNGDWVWCLGFVHGATANQHVMLYRDQEENQQTTQFKWDAVNTERLPSRFYWTSPKRVGFLSYLTQRQWKRGFSRGNTRLYNPAIGVSFNHLTGKAFEAQLTTPVPIDPAWFKAEALAKRYKQGYDTPFSDQFALISNAGLRYKENRIGQWHQGIQRLSLDEEIWYDELRDLKLTHLLTTKEEMSKVEKEDVGMYTGKKVSLEQALDMAWNVLPPIRRPPPNVANARDEQRVTDAFARLGRITDAEIAAMNHVHYEGWGWVERQREQTRQILNIRAGRNWNDNGDVEDEEDENV